MEKGLIKPQPVSYLVAGENSVGFGGISLGLVVAWQSWLWRSGWVVGFLGKHEW